MASFQIGQYRYTGQNCIRDISQSATKTYQTVSTGGDDSNTSIAFQDICISPNSSFVKGNDYYLKVRVPQDMNYDMTFNIKLLKNLTHSSVTYQFLKQITVSRGGNSSNVYNVVLYEKSDGSPAAMIPKTFAGAGTFEKDVVYYDASQKRYLIGMGGTLYTTLYNYNNLSVVASWKESESQNYGIFEMIFRPVTEGFDRILLEMVRTAEDYNIQRNSSSNTEYGRKVDISKVQFTLCEINNLVGYMNPGRSLSRIGVHGHSNLLMVINGEEIRIGPSGYYELDAIPIQSLGIVAPDKDYTNQFTIDYTYDDDEPMGA